MTWWIARLPNQTTQAQAHGGQRVANAVNAHNLTGRN